MSERDDDVTLPSGREDIYLERLYHHDDDQCPKGPRGHKTHVSLPQSGAIKLIHEAIIRASCPPEPVAAESTTAALQAEVYEWCEATFAGQTLAGKLQHLWEELHEVFAHCYQDKQLEEIADCALLTLEVASLSKVTLARPAKFDVAIDGFNPAEDFETSVRERFEVVRQRKWQPADAQGVFHHVKES